MKPSQAKKHFEKRIESAGVSRQSLTPGRGISLMLEFYRGQRADGCALDDDGDMLLFQWGTYDFGDGESFQLGITRQFIVADAEGDDAISQLSLTFHYQPSPTLAKLGRGERWCATPSELDAFEKFIVRSQACRSVADAKPAKIALAYDAV